MTYSGNWKEDGKKICLEITKSSIYHDDGGFGEVNSSTKVDTLIGNKLETIDASQKINCYDEHCNIIQLNIHK